MVSKLLVDAESFVTSLLLEKTPVGNSYHSLNHTKEVVATVIEIGKGQKVSEDDLEILTISAWFHDLGYTQKAMGHEEISAMFASGFLIENKYDNNKIDLVVGCILATKVPQQPKDYLQQIMCDADLHHLGSIYFEDRNNLYRKELEGRNKRKMTEYEWLVNTINFVTNHVFFTEYAKKNFVPIKEQNLKMLQEQLDKLL